MTKTIKGGKKFGRNTRRKILKQKSDTIPSFNQMYRNRSQLSKEDKEFLEDFVESNKLSNLFEHAQESGLEEIVELKDLLSKTKNSKKIKKIKKQIEDNEKFVYRNENSLVLFRSNYSNFDDINVEPIDFEHILDMNKRMTNEYLNEIKKMHTKIHMKGARQFDTDTMEYSYQKVEMLKRVLDSFIELWKRKNEAKKIISSWTNSERNNIPHEIIDRISIYQTSENKFLNELHK